MHRVPTPLRLAALGLAVVIWALGVVRDAGFFAWWDTVVTRYLGMWLPLLSGLFSLLSWLLVCAIGLSVVGYVFGASTSEHERAPGLRRNAAEVEAFSPRAGRISLIVIVVLSLVASALLFFAAFHTLFAARNSAPTAIDASSIDDVEVGERVAAAGAPVPGGEFVVLYGTGRRSGLGQSRLHFVLVRPLGSSGDATFVARVRQRSTSPPPAIDRRVWEGTVKGRVPTSIRRAFAREGFELHEEMRFLRTDDQAFWRALPLLLWGALLLVIAGVIAFRFLRPTAPQQASSHLEGSTDG